MEDGKYERWKEAYRRGGEGPYPWDLGGPRDFLVELVEKGLNEACVPDRGRFHVHSYP